MKMLAMNNDDDPFKNNEKELDGFGNNYCFFINFFHGDLTSIITIKDR